MIDWRRMLRNHQELNQFARVMLAKKQRQFLTSSERELPAWIYLTKSNCTPLYLSQASGMKKEAVSRCLKYLYEKGCIRREKNTDERSYSLILTERGENALQNDYETMLQRFYDLYHEMGNDFEDLFHVISNANEILIQRRGEKRMKFYDILQLDPQVIKNLMKNSSTQREKRKLGLGMFLRSVLIVLFAIVFISSLSNIFGSENTPMAVAIFCILLGVRFVDFGYCIKDELVTLSVAFLILLFSPILANSVFPLFSFFIHVISFFIILFITCDKPEMGNGGLFSFAYIYLSGNPVYAEALIQRFYLTLTGLAICGLIFYRKHKNKNEEIRFIDKIKEAKITDLKYQWMIRMAVGVSAILSLGLALNIERFMWAGFACGSLLSDYSSSPRIKERFIQRLIGVVLGSALFFFIYKLLPIGLHGLIGPLGGFCLGFCVDYKYKTAMNCLGALMIASATYGLQYSIYLRILDTVMGIVFAFSFFYLYERYISTRLIAVSESRKNKEFE